MQISTGQDLLRVRRKMDLLEDIFPDLTALYDVELLGGGLIGDIFKVEAGFIGKLSKISYNHNIAIAQD
jgi:hypothetical protein